jgi:hypothetical protein
VSPFLGRKNPPNFLTGRKNRVVRIIVNSFRVLTRSGPQRKIRPRDKNVSHLHAGGI